MALQRGDIVIADIPDPDGSPAKHRHPAMVLMADASATDVYVVAISTSFGASIPSNWIPMPHATNGHAVTGLKEPCVLKCDWVVRFEVSRLGPVIGSVPPAIVEQSTNIILREVARKKEANQRRGFSS